MLEGTLPMETEVFAAKLQLEELRQQFQYLRDAHLAEAVFLQPDDCEECHSTSAGTICSSEFFMDDGETSTLQDQITALSAFIASMEDQKAASDLQEQEAAREAALHASVEAAECLEAQERWHNWICNHDEAFARTLWCCDSEEWEERGDLLECPLHLGSRPPSPGGGAPQHGFVFNTRGAIVTGSSSNNNSSSSSMSAHLSTPLIPGNKGAGSVGPEGDTTGGGKGKRQMQPAASSSRGTSTRMPPTTEAHCQCSICFDSFPLSSMISATLANQVASSSAAEGRCGHNFCQGCMRSYVQEELKARHFPICCPMPSCHEELAHKDIHQLLGSHTQDLQLYEMLIMENTIDASLRFYCPYKDCSLLLERPEEGGQPLEDNQQPYQCPSCHRMFCLHCGTAGWHTGMTCQQFQALPPELRSVEDAAMLRMAARHAWKRCPAPGCGHIVERTEGCNHMHCRCGVGFCYACGKLYHNNMPTAGNVHGTPGCECPLFAVPEEEPPPHAQPAEPRAPLVLQRAKPHRGGRLVSRTRCWHSDSIYDCPQGPDRCWFWHVEDDV